MPNFCKAQAVDVSSKLQTGKESRSRESMRNNALDVDIGILRGRPQLDEDELSGAGNRSESVVVLIRAFAPWGSREILY